MNYVPGLNYKKQEELHADNKIVKGDVNKGKNIFDKMLHPAHQHFETLVKQYLAKNPRGTLLDYGCGTGSRTLKLLRAEWRLIGIDISRESIKIAQQNCKNTHLTAEYIVMDGEHMNFPDNKFDLIVDYGTFPSIDMQSALPELIRVLKPTGSIIAIETLGHNPLFTLHRKLNVWQGRRTPRAAQHIMKMSGWHKIIAHFRSAKMYYYGLSALIITPLISLFPTMIQSRLIKLCTAIDRQLFKVKAMKIFAFKTLVQFNNLKNN